jgi:hypothetical protein
MQDSLFLVGRGVSGKVGLAALGQGVFILERSEHVSSPCSDPLSPSEPVTRLRAESPTVLSKYSPCSNSLISPQIEKASLTRGDKS